jgi:hypothetical protein
MNFIFILLLLLLFYVEFAIACAALAIACAGLSIIAIWISGIYFQARRRTKKTIFALLGLSLLVLLICKLIN